MNISPYCHCGARMVAVAIGRSNAAAMLVGVVMCCIGIVIMVAIPCFGWIVGAIIIVCGLFQGGKRRKVWRCPACGSITERT